jgi:hypothetical protein
MIDRLDRRSRERYNPLMQFRSRLEATLRAVAPLFEVPGVLVGGSEVPNLLEPDAAATLVVSQDVDLVVPVSVHREVCARLQLLVGLHVSPDEPSVWLPDEGGPLIEVNFIGQDPSILDPADTYVFESPELPLLVFGPLSLLRPGQPVSFAGLRVPVPSRAGLLLEKLLTDRTALKGTRDLLVVAGLLRYADEADLDELQRGYGDLDQELRYLIRSNLVVLSLLEGLPDMPDPRPMRARVQAILGRLEAREEGSS